MRQMTYTGVILEGDLGEKVSLNWLTSPYFELREKWKCIEYIGKSKIWTKTSPWNPEIVTKLLPLWKLQDDPCIYSDLIWLLGKADQLNSTKTNIETMIFSSSEVLKVSYCDLPVSVVRRALSIINNFLKHFLNYWTNFHQSSQKWFTHGPFTKITQMVPLSFLSQLVLLRVFFPCWCF